MDRTIDTLCGQEIISDLVTCNGTLCDGDAFGSNWLVCCKARGMDHAKKD